MARCVAPAVELWLRSQLDAITALTLQLESDNGQLLSGFLPQVTLKAEQAVYRGLHLSQITLVGKHIRVNLGAMLRGHAFHLREPVPIEIELCWRHSDVQQSLGSALLQAGLLDVLQAIVGDQIQAVLGDAPRETWTLRSQHLILETNRLCLSAQLTADAACLPLALRTGLALATPQTLVLVNPEWLPSVKARRGLPLRDFDGYGFDLGPQVALHALTLTPEAILCQGQLTIFP